MGRWKRVRSRRERVVHWAPVVPAEEWMVDRVTLCMPRGQRKAWFEDYTSGPVTCARCQTLMIGSI
jgi:hypothetical protein